MKRTNKGGYEDYAHLRLSLPQVQQGIYRDHKSGGNRQKRASLPQMQEQEGKEADHAFSHKDF